VAVEAGRSEPVSVTFPGNRDKTGKFAPLGEFRLLKAAAIRLLTGHHGGSPANGNRESHDGISEFSVAK